jgi:uncharacterized protein
MPYGLKEEQIKSIQNIFASNPRVDEVFIFGSRAKGNFKPGSDIDLALKGKKLLFDDVLALHAKLDDLDLPYTFDIVNYEQINNHDLTDHINRVGISFYKNHIIL